MNSAYLLDVRLDVSLNGTDVNLWMEAQFEPDVSDVLIAFDPDFSYTKGIEFIQCQGCLHMYVNNHQGPHSGK